MTYQIRSEDIREVREQYRAPLPDIRMALALFSGDVDKTIEYLQTHVPEVPCRCHECVR